MGPVGRLRGSAIIFFYLNLKNIFSIVNYKFNSYLFYFLYQSLHLLNLEKTGMLLPMVIRFESVAILSLSPTTIAKKYHNTCVSHSHKGNF